MRKIDISIAAAQYAARIYLQTPGYTKSKAKQIFKQWYRLVMKYLYDVESSAIDTKYLNMTGNIALEARLAIATELFSTTEHLKVLYFNLHIATCELNEANNFEDAYKAFKKFERLKTEAYSYKLKFINKVAKYFPLFTADYNNLSNEWNTDVHARRSINVIIANKKRRRDNSYDPNEIRALDVELEKLDDNKQLLNDTHAMLELSIDSTFNSALSCIKPATFERSIEEYNTLTTYNEKEIRRAYRKGVL